MADITEIRELAQKLNLWCICQSKIPPYFNRKLPH